MKEQTPEFWLPLFLPWGDIMLITTSASKTHQCETKSMQMKHIFFFFLVLFKERWADLGSRPDRNCYFWMINRWSFQRFGSSMSSLETNQTSAAVWDVSAGFCEGVDVPRGCMDWQEAKERSASKQERPCLPDWRLQTNRGPSWFSLTYCSTWPCSLTLCVICD